MARENRSTREKRKTESSLVKNLLSYKVLAFGSGVNKTDLVEYLRDNADNLRGGQKRLVVDNPDNKDEILKISYTLDGLYDNMNDVLCYNTLCDLLDKGEISNDDIQLFSNARMLNDDPMIIVEKAHITYRDCNEFQEWKKDNKDRYRDLYDADLWATFISTVEDLKEDHDRIQNILRKYFIPSDATLTVEPDNYGIAYEGNKLRLVFYDMGSVLPIAYINGRYIRPVCECGGDLEYLPIQMVKGAELSHADAELLDGIYACHTKDCRFNGLKIRRLGKVPSIVRDSRIYADYFRDNKKYFDELYAYECNWYEPDVPCQSKNSYIDEFEYHYKDKKTEEDYDIMFTNYLCLEVGRIFDILGRDMDDLQDDVLEYKLTYNEFLKDWDVLVDEVLDRNRDKLTELAGAWCFLSGLASAALTMEDILKVTNLKDFDDLLRRSLEVDLSNDEIDALWDTIDVLFR